MIGRLLLALRARRHRRELAALGRAVEAGLRAGMSRPPVPAVPAIPRHLTAHPSHVWWERSANSAECELCGACSCCDLADVLDAECEADA